VFSSVCVLHQIEHLTSCLSAGEKLIKNTEVKVAAVFTYSTTVRYIVMLMSPFQVLSLGLTLEVQERAPGCRS